jgi:hypothetical protein
MYSKTNEENMGGKANDYEFYWKELFQMDEESIPLLAPKSSKINYFILLTW